MPRQLRELALGLVSPVVFIVCFRRWGPEAAIASAVIVAIAQTAYLRARDGRLSPVFLLPAVLTLLFGGLDLAFAGLDLYRYQAFVQNALVALACAAAAVFRWPLLSWLESSVSELAGIARGEKRAHAGLTAAWAGYFGAKALLYLSLAYKLRLDSLVLVRTVFGLGSFLLLAAYTFIRTRARPRTRRPA